MPTISQPGRFALAMGLALALSSCDALQSAQEPTLQNVTPVTPGKPYAPQILPANFVPGTPNSFFPLVQGTVYRYRTEDGAELNEVEVIGAGSKTILGVAVIVVHDRVYVDENGNGIADGTSCGPTPGFTSELIEETFDWYAPDNARTVWYFGEDSKEYDHCTLVGTTGSWEAGMNGAQPGIIMLATPVIGQSYRQELLAGIAEDWAKVVSLKQAVSVPYDDFEGCVETIEWTPLEPGHRASKYYCEGVGLVLEVTPSGGRERNELISKTP